MNGHIQFENPAAVAAIEVLREGFARGLLPKANFALGRDPFMDGTVANDRNARIADSIGALLPHGQVRHWSDATHRLAPGG